jgi:hypothetical protein
VEKPLDDDDDDDDDDLSIGREHDFITLVLLCRASKDLSTT